MCLICVFSPVADRPSRRGNHSNATVILIYTRLTLANDKSVPPERRSLRRSRGRGKNTQTTQVASAVIDWNKSHFVFSQMTRGRVILGIFFFFFSPSPAARPILPFSVNAKVTNFGTGARDGMGKVQDGLAVRVG